MAVKTILLKGQMIRKERIAGAAITPGYLVEENSSGNLIPHNSAGENAIKAFAIENEVVGQDIDTDYAANDTVLYGVAQPGSEVYALVAAGASAIVIGDFLESAGDGTVRKEVTSAATSDQERAGVVGRALEAVNNSGGGTEARIKIEIA